MKTITILMLIYIISWGFFTWLLPQGTLEIKIAGLILQLIFAYFLFVKDWIRKYTND
jgi:succinate-acetate transporter protein